MCSLNRAVTAMATDLKPSRSRPRGRVFDHICSFGCARANLVLTMKRTVLPPKKLFALLAQIS